MDKTSELVTTEETNVVLVKKVPIYKNLNKNLNKRSKYRKRADEFYPELQQSYPKLMDEPQDTKPNSSENKIPKLQEPSEKVTIIERAVGFFTVIEDKETLTNSLNTSITKGLPFICKICQNWFIGGSKLKVHYVLNHDILHCPVCSCLFETEAAKEKHLLEFHSFLFCEICQNHFTSYPILLQHYGDAHNSTTCIFCGILQPKSDTISHMLKKHCVTSTFFENFEENKFITSHHSSFFCGVCEKKRETDTFFGHMHCHHKISITSLLNMMTKQNLKISIIGAPIQNDSKDKILPMNLPRTQLEDGNRCFVCSRSYTRKIRSVFHQVYCQSKIKCTYCNKIFETTSKRSTHIKKAHTFRCELKCERLHYKNEEDLIAHYLSLHKKISCEFCEIFLDVEEENYSAHLTEYHKYKMGEKRQIQTLFHVAKIEGQEIIKCCLCDENITLLSEIIKDLFSHFFIIHNVSLKRIEQLITPKPKLNNNAVDNKTNIWIKQEIVSDEETLNSQDETSNYTEQNEYNDKSEKKITKKRRTRSQIKQESEEESDTETTSNNNLQYLDNIATDFDFQQIQGILNSESESEDEIPHFEYICDLCGKEDNSLLNLLTHLKKIHDINSKFNEISCQFCSEKYLNSFTYGKHLLVHKNDNLNVELFSCGCDNVVFNTARQHVLQVHSSDLSKFEVEKVGLKCRFCSKKFWKRTEVNEHEVSVHLEENKKDFLKCYECFEVFSSQKCLKNHMNQTHQDSPEYTKLNYKCIECSVVYPNIEFAREHFDTNHPEDIIFKCPVPNCFMTSKYKRSIRNHLKSPHNSGATSVKVEPCDICGKVSRTSTAATIHKLTKHKAERGLGYQCRICRGRYHTDEQRKLHYSIAHAGQMAYTCVECGSGFVSRSKLYAHKEMHKEKKKRVCPYCNKEFSRKDSFNEHLLIHIGPKHQCPHCPKSFTQRSNLTRHVRIHTGDKPHKCSYCEKAFSDKGACSSHQKVHTKEEHCACSYCGKKFTKRQKLRYHMKFHTGEGLITCEICQKQFSNTYAYKEHKRTHNQSTVLVCECGQGFTKQKYLLQHMASKHNTGPTSKYVCPICKQISYYKFAYVEHVMGHATNKHIKCTLCSKEYTSRKAVRKHIHSKHGIPSLEEANAFFIQLTPEEVGLIIPPDSEFLTIFSEFSQNNSDAEVVESKLCQNSDSDEEKPISLGNNLRKTRRKTVRKTEVSSDSDDCFEDQQEDIVIETRAKRKVKKPVRYSAS